MNNIFTICILLFGCSCTQQNNKMNTKEDLCVVKAKIVGDTISYQINNIGNQSLYISSDYFLTIQENGDGILESIPKSKLINYNRFISPSLIQIKKGNTFHGTTTSSQAIKAQLYIRVFYKDYESEKEMNLSEFTDFEKKSSFLIKVET